MQSAPTSPPSWVTRGTQLSYQVGQATLQGGLYELIEDPNGPLVDPSTGKRYRESYGGTPTGQGSGNSSSEAIVQFSVAALDGTDVLLTSWSVNDDLVSGTRYLGPAQTTRSPAAAPGFPWIHPDLLAGYRTGHVGQWGHRLVLAGELTLGGTTYQTVSLVEPTAGSYSLVTYDVATGVVLQSSSRVQSQTGGPAMLGLFELRGIRQAPLPGLGSAVPAWLTRSTTLRYAGTQRWTNTFDGTWQDFPARVEVTFPEVGPDWARFTANTVVTMLSDVPSTHDGIAAGAGPYWYDPTALAAMTEGQVLDSDPLTGQTIRVSRVVQGPTGSAVVLSVSLPGVEADTAWDVTTGVMLARSSSTRANGIATHVELQSMP